jgi:hypothetical protein
MNEQQRTDLLNYLNDNKIKYNFDITTQSITIDIEVTIE